MRREVFRKGERGCISGLEIKKRHRRDGGATEDGIRERKKE
jgi:hypothetical protein